jgi:hypothetical protein
MKKLLFSAVTLVAFSSVSNGNTIILKEEKIEHKEIEQAIIISDTPSAEEWLRDVENLMDMCATYEEACVIANRAFEKCLDDMYGE